MPNPFNDVAKVALDEIVRKHMTDSKYGYFVTEESLESMVQELLDFLRTSRQLKSAGDKIFGGQTEKPSESLVRYDAQNLSNPKITDLE